MRGISEERLGELEKYFNSKGIYPMLSINELISECQELSPPIPIDENTPKDRRILLFFPGYGWYDGKYLIRRRDGVEVFAASASLSVPLGIFPTHWQELPETPK